MFRLFFCGMLALGVSSAIFAQTSETNPRLKAGLNRYPAADTDNDGILTLAEARAFIKKHPEHRQTLGGREDEAKAPEGRERYVYKTVGDVSLSLYVFTPAGHNRNSKLPAAVFFFGGGWASGSPDQFQPQCQHLADRGMIGITVDYRVASRHSAKVEDCVEDAKSAMRWVRSNAAKLGIDTERIAACGGSAGGHLAACTAVIEEINSATDDLDVSAKPNAMILFNPALAVAADERLSSEELRMAESVSSRARTSMANVSPLKFASTKQPPMIMFYGTKDPLLGGAMLYKQDSENVGNSCKLVTYDGQEHGFFNREKFRELTTKEMEKFLTELGWLPQVASR